MKAAKKRAKNGDRNKSEDCRLLDFVRRAMAQVCGRSSHIVEPVVEIDTYNMTHEILRRPPAFCLRFW
jgi:hypothetical protein